MKLTKDLNLHPEIIKILEKNMESTLQEIGMGKDFSKKSPKPQVVKVKISGNTSH